MLSFTLCNIYFTTCKQKEAYMSNDQIGKLTNAEMEAILNARNQTQLIKDAQRKETDGQAYAMVSTKAMSNINHLYPPPREQLLISYFIYKMNKTNAIIVSQKRLCAVLKCSRPTLTKIIGDLQANRIIDVVKVGVQNCYIFNSQVAWKSSRSGIKHSIFNATVVVDWDEQFKDSIDLWNKPLISLSKEVILEAKQTVNNHILDDYLTEDKQEELEL